MPKSLSLREIRALKAEYQERPENTVRCFREALDSGQIDRRSLSLRDLFVGLVENGEEIIREFDPRNSKAGITLTEAGNAVDTSTFANINGQIMYSTVLDEYQLETEIVNEVCETVPTRFNGERIPGIGAIGDESQKIQEGQEYPIAGVNEQYIETPQTVKVGTIIPVTKEAIFFDRTNILLNMCSEVGKYVGVQQLQAVLGTVMGLTINGINYNTYNRNGTNTNTYLTSGAYINDLTGGTANPLVDWTSIQTAEITLSKITDPNTGLPITVQPAVLLAPPALKYTARRITTATEVRTLYPGLATQGASANVSIAAPGNVEMITKNPLENDYKVVTSRWVYYYQNLASATANTWYLISKKSFAWMENWPVTVVQAPTNSEAEFTQDIVMRYKASFRGNAAVREPRFSNRNQPS